MIFWIAAAALLLIAVLAVLGWWGAGLTLHPPLMSAMEIFPEQYGLRYEKVVFKTEDGLTIKGWFIPSPNPDPETHPTLLMCHGWGDNKGELLKITHFLSKKAGFNLFYFDHRSHGESDGDITTLGPLETVDFSAAVTWLEEKKPWTLKNLGVFGLSMGASVAALSIPSYPEVKAVVLESPFTNYRQVTSQWAWNRFKVPYFPVMWVVYMFLRWRSGVPDIDSYDPVRSAGDIAPRPLLVIGGTADRLMPEKVVRGFYAAAKEPKTLWMVPGAAHAKCHEVAGFEYESRIISFFKHHLK